MIDIKSANKQFLSFQTKALSIFEQVSALLTLYSPAIHRYLTSPQSSTQFGELW